MMQQWSYYLDGLEGRGENITIRLKKWGKLVEFLKRNKGIWGLVIQAPFLSRHRRRFRLIHLLLDKSVSPSFYELLVRSHKW
jgi:hypothetical protein